MLKLYDVKTKDMAIYHIANDSKLSHFKIWGGYLVVKSIDKYFRCYYMVNKPKNIGNVVYILAIKK